MKYYQLDVEFKFTKDRWLADSFYLHRYATLGEGKKEAEKAKEDLSFAEPVDNYLLGSDLPKDTSRYIYDYFKIEVDVWEDEDYIDTVYETDWAIIRLNK